MSVMGGETPLVVLSLVANLDGLGQLDGCLGKRFDERDVSGWGKVEDHVVGSRLTGRGGDIDGRGHVFDAYLE